MKYLSVCSGIEAATVAWHELGWSAAGLSEIEAFPAAVLQHHYPDVCNFGDMTRLAEWLDCGFFDPPDILVGGTPCQAFSVAGLRRSLDDARGNLSLVYCRLADAIDTHRADLCLEPSIVVWENVPGVLSTHDNAFGCFLAGLAGEDDPLVPSGKRWPNAGAVYGPKRAVAWRILDAQYFGVAQRRRRVFVVASARDGFDPAAVLFEFGGVRRDTPPSREAGEDVTGSTGNGVARCLTAGEMKRQDWETCNFVAFSCKDYGADAGPLSPTLRAMGHGASHANAGGQVAVAFAENSRAEVRLEGGDGQRTGASSTGGGKPGQGVPMVAFPANLSGTQSASSENLSPTLGAKNPTAVATTLQVRRLTPRECERLQGFPDDYTLIPWKAHQAWAKKKGAHTGGKSFEEWLIETTGRGLRQPTALDCPDGPRYKALGNSMAVPVMRWIGRRIAKALA